MRSLIAYFFRRGNNYMSGRIVDLPVGNTEIAAKKIQSLVGGDLFEIQTVHSYSEDYQECTKEAKVELQTDARPELTDDVQDMARYDTVFLGFPNWWGAMPMGVCTFLDRYDFTGMTILPFCTHEGSGMGSSERDIQGLCAGARVLPGLAVHGGSVGGADQAIKDWLHQNKLL